MIDSLFLYGRIREKHRSAPLFAERVSYLSYLLEIGTCRERLRNVATMLLHVVRLLKLDSLRPMGMDEILKGCELWVNDPIAHRHRKGRTATPQTFQVVATHWLRFHESLIEVPKPEPLFGRLLADFLNAMRSQRGLSRETLDNYRAHTLRFLNWLQSRCAEFSHLQASDIDAYFDPERLIGLSRSTIRLSSTVLRMFIGHAEQQGWCSSGIRATVPRPRVPSTVGKLSIPLWDDIRRFIASIPDFKAADLRAKALFLLFSVYGLRSAEVRGLTLEDIDWFRGSLIVHRAKRGKTQQLPLQPEVGDAIALYLEKARPKCRSRVVFVTLTPPHRPITKASMHHLISDRLKTAGIAPQGLGPHMLRRACATQLLRTGSPLQEIADFLGHSNLKSVSHYARFDPASLQHVAEFSLQGLL